MVTKPKSQAVTKLDTGLVAEITTNFPEYDVLKNITVTVEMIGPKEARAIMEATNFKNRRVKQRTVTRYAHDMQNKHWKLAPEPLVFDEMGNLFQGQHRILAVIEGEVVVPFLVIRGWSNEVYDVLDSGLKRTVADVLTSEFELSSFNTISAASRLLGAVDIVKREPEVNIVTHAYKITKPEILETARKYMDDLEWADKWMYRLRSNNALRGIGPSATTASITLLAQNNDREIVGEFLIDLLEGKFAKNDPRLVLTRWNPVIRAQGITANIQSMAVFVKAWNAVWEGRTVGLLKWKTTEKFPEVVQAVKK